MCGEFERFRWAGAGLFRADGVDDSDATAAQARGPAAGKGAAGLAGDIRGGVAVVVCNFPSEGAELCPITADNSGDGIRESTLPISSTLAPESAWCL